MHRFVVLLILVPLAGCQFAGGGFLPAFVAPGTLQGHVNIGPLLPVQRVGEATPTVPPAAYAARQIVVYQADGKTVVTKLTPNSDGNYRVDLAPGVYVVGMVRVGIDRASGLPATVTIESGKTVTLNIDIDTGIR
jgi:hypothetical protein